MSNAETAPHNTPNTDAELVEQMAQRSVLYLNSFDEHARAIRGRDKEEISNAYQEVSKNGALGAHKLSPSELAGLERSLHAPAHTTDDHVRISLTAHSLLSPHIDAIGKLSPDIADKIDARVNELRAQAKPKEDLSSSTSRFWPFVRPPPLPELTRPTSPKLSPLDADRVQVLLADPTELVKKMFFLADADLYYRIAKVEMSMDRRTFHLQYEDTTCLVEDRTESEMKDMLADSALVT